MKIDVQAIIDRLIRQTPKMCATDAQQMLLHHYETSYGIFDHDHVDDKNNPLALIAMHPAEMTNGLLFERFDEFEERQIGQRFNISIIEFLSMPREWCDYMSLRAVKRQKETVDLQEKGLRELTNLTEN